MASDEPMASTSAAPQENGADVDVGAMPIPVEELLTLHMKWSGKAFQLDLSSSDLVFDLRSRIQSLTEVPPAAQKILGLTRGKLGSEVDGERLAALGIKNGARFQMVGTPEHLRFKERRPVPPPSNEIDIKYPQVAFDKNGELVPPARDPRNLRIVSELVRKYPITLMNPPRPGKKLLVLDIDYTIVDTRPMMDGALPSEECARPGLHKFLELMYPHYDIVMWSQTHWRWLETKLVELGIIGGDAEYKIAFVADRSTMFPIFSKRSGEMVKHEVKPLAYFWQQHPQWSAKNTIHIDDLSRNFALNPGEGLKIRAFKGAGTMEGVSDRELDRLGAYLLDIADEQDFRLVDHSRWKNRAKAAQEKARMDAERQAEERAKQLAAGTDGNESRGHEADGVPEDGDGAGGQ